MHLAHAPWILTGLALLGAGPGLAAARPDDPPALVGPTDLLQDDYRSTGVAAEEPRHEAFADAPAAGTASLRASQAPPAPIAERPQGLRPSPDAQWVNGYWGWDAEAAKYNWVAGNWVVPPEGRVWVDGRWRRDDRGWVRVSGSWRESRDERSNWRKDGPPADHPEDAPGKAPGPDYFFVSGRYIPDGDGLAWKPGFWAKAQPGWEWIPAHWVRRADEWAYREGRWDKAPEDRTAPAAAPGNESPFRGRTLVSQPRDAGPTSEESNAVPDAANATSRTAARPVLDIPNPIAAPRENRLPVANPPAPTLPNGGVQDARATTTVPPTGSFYVPANDPTAPGYVRQGVPPQVGPPPAEANPNARRNDPRANARNGRRPAGGPLQPVFRGLFGARKKR